MPRVGESQLSLSVRQEGSGAMRMLLRAAYNLTHELENSFPIVHPVERESLPTGGLIQLENLSTLTFMHSTTCLTPASSIIALYIEQTRCTFSPAVDSSTAGLSMHLDSERIHSLPLRADRTGLSRPSTLYHLFTAHLVLSS